MNIFQRLFYPFARVHKWYSKHKFNIVTVLIITAITYWSVSSFRYSWENDCLTKMQMLKNIGNVLTLDGEKKCK